MSIRIRKASEADVDEIYMLMERTKKEIAQPDWYVIDDRNYVSRHVREEGFILKAEEEGRMLGFLLIHFPGAEEDHLGNYLDLDEEELRCAAYMDSVAVKPKARGKGLMGRLMSQAESMLKEMGYTRLMGTVHPDNSFSHGNFARQGYQDVIQVKKYGGLPRIVVCKWIGN